MKLNIIDEPCAFKGTIKGGFGYNIIADKVQISGTCRSFKKDVQELQKKRMGEICCGVAATYGGEIKLKYEYVREILSHEDTIETFPF